MAGPPSIAEVWEWLGDVPDPEIPAVSLTDLGIVRDVAWDGDTLVVAVTPTYSGCPATAVIEEDIAAALAARGVARIALRRQLAPAWTTDWITPAAREKLRAHGIAPPVDGTAATGRRTPAPAVACPRCGSARTVRVSHFGSTPCKASWRCEDCREPFDHFKCI